MKTINFSEVRNLVAILPARQKAIFTFETATTHAENTLPDVTKGLHAKATTLKAAVKEAAQLLGTFVKAYDPDFIMLFFYMNGLFVGTMAISKDNTVIRCDFSGLAISNAVAEEAETTTTKEPQPTTNTPATMNEVNVIEKAQRPADVMDAAAFDAGFILKSRNSVACRWYWLQDSNGGDAHNGKGERLVIEVTECNNPGGVHSIPRAWHKAGLTPTELQTWWSVKTYVTDTDGNCFGKYNPQHTPDNHQLNFKWVNEATPGNLRKLLTEVARQFFNA